MSAFIVSDETIRILTQATDAMLRMNKKYPGSYPLAPETLEVLSKYTNDLQGIYAALYVANVTAVCGRYGHDVGAEPVKYSHVFPWDIDRLSVYQLKQAAGRFACFMYQCSEDPVYGTPLFNAFYDVRKLLCMILVSKSIDWDGADR